MTRHDAAMVLLTLAVSALCPGCGPTYRDPATGVEARYEWETLTAELDLEIGDVYPAARAAVDALDLRVLRDKLDGIAAEIRALDAHFDNVDVKLEAMPEARTLLTIRVGLFGNKNKSVVLFDQIVQNLAQREETFTKYLRPDRDP